MPDALTSTFTAVNRQTRGDLPQLDGTNTTRFRPTYLRHAGPTSVKLPQIGWERTLTESARGAVSTSAARAAGTRTPFRHVMQPPLRVGRQRAKRR